MAQRRMFSLKIIDTDAFIEMPISARLLYFDLCMRADDEGFVDKHKTIMRMTGSSEDDYKVLVAKKFIIPFESGVCVIKHWLIHNYIQSDRKQLTNYTKEKEQLFVKANKGYTLDKEQGKPLMYPKCIQDVSIGKDRLGEVKLEKVRKVQAKKEKKPSIVELYSDNISLIKTINDFIDMRKKIKSPMTDKAIELMLTKLNKLSNNEDVQIQILNESIMNNWKGIFELKVNNKNNGKDMSGLMEFMNG